MSTEPCRDAACNSATELISLTMVHNREREEKSMIPIQDFACGSQQAENVQTPLPSRIALVDARGEIVAVEKQTIRAAAHNDSTVGRSGNRSRSRSGDPLTLSRSTLTRARKVLEKNTSISTDGVAERGCGPAYVRTDITPISYGRARVAICETPIRDLVLSSKQSVLRLRQLAERLIDTQEDERRRISQEMHDDLGNRVALLSWSLRNMAKQYAEKSGSTAPELERMLEETMQIAASLRNMSHQLHPGTLQCVGLGVALESLAERFRKQSGIGAEVSVAEQLRSIYPKADLCIYRVAQKCLENVTKHARADHVWIVVARLSRRVQLTVSDNGCGFIPSEVMNKGGLGLLEMDARAWSVRGTLRINSAPGRGTEVCLTVPIRNKRSAVTVQ